MYGTSKGTIPIASHIVISGLTIQGFGFTSECKTSEAVYLQATGSGFDQELFVVSSALYNVNDPVQNDRQAWFNTGIRFNATY